MYSKTSYKGLSERRTTSVQHTNSLPLIALSIKIVHLECTRSGHLSTLDSGQPVCSKLRLLSNLQEQNLMEPKTVSTKHKKHLLLS